MAACCGAALASAGVVAALDHAGIISPGGHRTAAPTLSVVTKSDRLASVPSAAKFAERLPASTQMDIDTPAATAGHEPQSVRVHKAALAPGMMPALAYPGEPHGTPGATRIAFVPQGAIPLRTQPLVEESWPQVEILPEQDQSGENPDAWGTKTLSDQNIPPARETLKRVAKLAPEPAPASSGQKEPDVPAKIYSLEERLSEISPGATMRLAAKFNDAGAAWPPQEAGLVAIKDKKRLELFVRSGGGVWQFVHAYPVLAASGGSGPKLKQGDKQVPEGVYGVSFLNPNSRYHVSLRVKYPNAFDKQMAAKEGRKNLGGDIMIHGKAVSIGCLAIGDEAAEEMFVLADRVGLKNIKLVIAPSDFRREPVPQVAQGQPVWLPQLYTQVASAMAEFPAPPQSAFDGLMSFFEK